MPESDHHPSSGRAGIDFARITQFRVQSPSCRSLSHPAIPSANEPLRAGRMTPLAAPRRLSRRGFLTIGSLGLGGLTLPGLLRAESSPGSGSAHKAVILI